MRKSILMSVLFINLLSISGYTSSVYADTEAENATLARIAHELDALQPLINEAQSEQPRYARVRFNYDKLRADVNKIKQGINQQLSNSPIEPRTIAPLSGDYVQVEHLKP